MPIYAASLVAPVVSRAITDGAVWIRERRILSVGRAAAVLAEAGEAGDVDVRDLGRAILMPGLVNAHTHLELSWMGSRSFQAEDYTSWVRELLSLRLEEDPSERVAAAERSIESLRDGGTVAVGDVANGDWIVPLLARSGLYALASHEILGLRADDAESLMRRAAEQLDELAADADCIAAKDRCRVALAPHAPHTTSASLLRALAGRSEVTGDPLTIHVAESQAEVQLLQSAEGPLADLFKERDFWDASWKAPELSPVGYLDRLGLLSPRTLAVHCVQLARHEHAKLQARGVTVVTCPRSNQRLNVGHAPVPELLREGIPVALGTDSLASCPDLDLFAEMAALREVHPDLKAPAILRIATLNGARALGFESELGSIEPGKRAELIVVPLEANLADPLEALLSIPEIRFHLDKAPWTALGTPE